MYFQHFGFPSQHYDFEIHPVITGINSFVFFLKKDFIHLFLEKGWEKEWERNNNVWLLHMHPLLRIWPATQACALTRN